MLPDIFSGFSARLHLLRLFLLYRVRLLHRGDIGVDDGAVLGEYGNMGEGILCASSDIRAQARLPALAPSWDFS